MTNAQHTLRYLTVKTNAWSLQDLDRVVSVDNNEYVDFIEEALHDLAKVNPHAHKLLHKSTDKQFDNFIKKVIRNL